MGVKSTPIGEQQAEEAQPTLVKPAKEASAGKQPTGEQAAVKPIKEPSATRAVGRGADDRGKVGRDADRGAAGRQGQRSWPPDFLSYHACLPPAAYTTAYDDLDDDMLHDDAEEDADLPELDPNMHANPEHRWDITTMTVKEALASWKGKAVKAAMDEEIRSLIGMGTWELVERPRGVNIMKNRWVLMTKYHIDNTVAREKARLVVKGFTQIYGADYDKTYAPVSSYVTLRIFLSIVAVLDLHLMQLDMKNAFLQSNQDRALDDVLIGAGWKKSQVDQALYFKVGSDGVAYWVLVYVDDLLAASSSTAMLKELKELLEAAFKLREISPVYADKQCRWFIEEVQTGRTPKTPVSVDAYVELTFDDEEAQERQEEEYRQKVGSLQIAATTTRPVIAFACSTLGSGLTERSDQHWREVDRCLAYLANARDTALEFGGGSESLKLRIKCATLSSTESEYVAATEAGKEGRRLRFLLAEFRQLDAGTPTVLRVDNKSAITVAEGMGLTCNLKHMEQRYAWLQHMVKRGKFLLKYIPTTEQPADFLTKALHYPAFNRCSVAIGQVRLADVSDGDDDVQQ
ncbi:unnamed protein product [Closterium sp. Naga37s-1]|nr:unnamed protein product [Closterium sp. Naga37s-1]